MCLHPLNPNDIVIWQLNLKDQTEPDVERTDVCLLEIKPLMSMPSWLRFPCLLTFTSFWLIKSTAFKMRERGEWGKAKVNIESCCVVCPHLILKSQTYWLHLRPAAFQNFFCCSQCYKISYLLDTVRMHICFMIVLGRFAHTFRELL